MNEQFKRWLWEIGSSKFLSFFEPKIDYIGGVRLGKARYISNSLARLNHDSFITLPAGGYGRNTVLAGIWMFLSKNHKREYLITAFGKRLGAGYGRPSSFRKLHLTIGSMDKVNFTPGCLKYLEAHISSTKNPEIYFVHNHPENLLGAIFESFFDWAPLPSRIDRTTAFRFKLRAFSDWLESSNVKRFRFFLVESNKLLEFKLPHIPSDYPKQLLKYLWRLNGTHSRP